MDTKFNVFEVLTIAQQIERKGAKFYLTMAQRFENENHRDIFYRVANWKAKHEKIWGRLKKRFSEKTGQFGTFDPDNYVLSNPEVMAGLTSFGTKQNLPSKLTGKETKAQIIRDIISRTNEVIIFYQGLKDFARDPASREVIDKILREHGREIRLLNEEMKDTQ